MDKLLDRAILIAAKAHLGQVGRDGEPYVLHPIRMMIQAKTGEEKTVAVLHDVIEKTSEDISYESDARFIIARISIILNNFSVFSQNKNSEEAKAFRTLLNTELKNCKNIPAIWFDPNSPLY
mgnify:CR=1 FL=1